MNTALFVLIKKLVALSYLLGIASLVLGASLVSVAIPARAASAEETPTGEVATPATSVEETASGEVATPAASVEETATGEAPTPEPLACTPPGDWGRTVRLYYKSRTEKNWTFEVDEPQMDVTLTFFYYQDYDPSGCPFDCSTGDCQTEEIGEGESPFGSFSIADGQEGASDGTVRQNGRLTQGTYTASFHVTGTGSINIGLKVDKRSVPTETAVPPTPTALPPTPTEATPNATATITEEVLPPVPAATDTPAVTEGVPPTTGEAPTATPVEATNPPIDVVTATPTQGGPIQPPATLPPPSIPTLAGNPPALIPETGADLSSMNFGNALGIQLFFKLGFALVGVALILQGINRRNRSG